MMCKNHFYKRFIFKLMALFIFMAGFPLAAASKKKTEPVRIMTEINKQEPVYGINEEIAFTVSGLDTSENPVAKSLECALYVNGKKVQDKKVPFQKKCVFKIKLDKPGWTAVKAVALDTNGKQVKKMYPRNKFDTILSGGIGVMVAPEEIRTDSSEPEDFMSFWKQLREELNKVPVKAEREQVEVPDKYRGKIACYDVKVNCAGGMPVSGYLSIPTNAVPKSLPAIIYFDGAGVRSATKPLWYRKAIAFHINAHGIENGQPAEYYASLNAGKLHNYKYQGKNSRDTFYFKGMLLRAMRALDYLKTLPEWDGKTLITFGGSMGGGQAIAAAALDKQVTTCLAILPAFGDLDGEVMGRLAAYPQAVKLNNGESEKAVINTVRYFDTVNFAKHIKCETILCTGLIDFTCPPTSVYLIYNSLPKGVAKKIVVSSSTGHKYYTPPEMKQVLKKVW